MFRAGWVFVRGAVLGSKACLPASLASAGQEHPTRASRDSRTVSRLYRTPLGHKTTQIGNHCVRLEPPPPVPAPRPQPTWHHQAVVLHLSTASRGSPLPAAEIHTHSLVSEAPPHGPPACSDFSRTRLSAPTGQGRGCLS